MFVRINDRIEEQNIRALIGYSVFPDPERVEQAVDRYRGEEGLSLFGVESEGEIVGIVGARPMADDRWSIEHLAVRPDCRGAGFGRGLILELIEQVRPQELVAETDEEAVDFYRWIGFEVESLGELFPGAERFRCTYRTDEEPAQEE
ncbi:GNAT family N-acetyltransferase [Paenibacillus sp. TRM 82003]|nr:GNAT family N-acetyltransferase [Paenibacillus sp. TRM 82003]